MRGTAYLGAGRGEGAGHTDQDHPLALAEVAGLDTIGRRVLEEGGLGQLVSDLKKRRHRMPGQIGQCRSQPLVYSAGIAHNVVYYLTCFG